MGSMLSCIGQIIVAVEKMSLTITSTVLVCCVMITIAIVTAIGIGLGYNYCFVDMKTRYRYVPAHYIYPGSPRWPYPPDNRYHPGMRGAAPYRRNADQDLDELQTDFDSDYQDRADKMLESYVMDNISNSTNDLLDHSFNISTSTEETDNEDIDDIEVRKFKPTKNVEPKEREDEDNTTSKTIIPLRGPELIALLAKLRADDKNNYTLQLITT